MSGPVPADAVSTVGGAGVGSSGGGRVAVIGEAARVCGFGLAGLTVLTTDGRGPEAAWELLPEGTGLVVLTTAAFTELEARLAAHPRLLWAVMPS